MMHRPPLPLLLLLLLPSRSRGARAPAWAVAGAPDASQAHCGFPTPSPGSVASVEVYHADLTVGAYNHAVMLDWHQGSFLLTWKNSHRDEDAPGQRILFAQSADGFNWTKVGPSSSSVLFPGISTRAKPAALFGAPTVILNEKRYAAASPEQFCLFPAPAASPVLLRRVGPGIPAALGPVFWLSDSVPAGYEEVSAKQGIKGLKAMDAETQADVAQLRNVSRLPCDTTASLKCEACKDGCDYNYVASAAATTFAPAPDGHDLGGGAEYTHYSVPNATDEIILHRTRNHSFTFTHRSAVDAPWSKQRPTSIQDADSNLNAGTLPDGRIFLTSNACPKGRDPLVVSTSSDGWQFDKAVAVMTCSSLDGQCKPRYAGRSKNPGHAYPQSVAVTEPESMRYLWVAATNNKEDVWVARVPFDAL